MAKKRKFVNSLTIEQLRARSLEYAKGNIKPCPHAAWKVQRAQQLREHPTHAERCIGKPLRKMGFEQSVVLFGYIADFYHAGAKLVVEIDGPYHQARLDKDRARDAHLAQRGIRTIRLTNEQVGEYLPGNLDKIRQALSEAQPMANGGNTPPWEDDGESQRPERAKLATARSS